MSQAEEEVVLQEAFRVEVEPQKKVFEDKYFELNNATETLKIYDYNKDYPTKVPKLWKEINVNFISKVRDARELRPKAGICFCITNAGEEIFVQAHSVEVMKRWIQALNQACRIVVPPVNTPNLKPCNTRQEVAGGVLVPVVTKQADSGDESHIMPALSQPCVYSGYAVKQGGMRKNWKKRYFLLDEKGLHYFKDDQEKEPIKSLPLIDIKHARHVKGEHHPHRKYLFEVITETRTYNIECETESDCDTWVTEINKIVEAQPLFPEKSGETRQYSDSGIPMESETTKYTFQQDATTTLHSVHHREKKQYSDTVTKQSYMKKRSSDEEEPTISSHSVWSDTDNQPEVDQRSKSGLKGLSRKNWALW